MNYYFFDQAQVKELKARMYSAYFSCRKNKRGTYNALSFELNQEKELERLVWEVLSDSYTIGRSLAFIVYRPVQREIFAARFRDRIIHHYIIDRLEPIIERLLIYDTYSCRQGKGTSFGIERMTRFLRACSDSYRNDCYVLKLDIQGFFMNIDKELLLSLVLQLIDRRYHDFDKELLVNLVRKVITYNPVDGCIVKGSRGDWKGLPQNKSLFHSRGTKGLPIGNLTSQIFANLYLNALDQFVKRELKIRYYGRYVDDFVMIHNDFSYLKSLISRVECFLREELHLSLHPRKISLQHYRKGFAFTGIYIKPNCRYVGKRVASHLKQAFRSDVKRMFICEQESEFLSHRKRWIASVNSLLGMVHHHNSYRLCHSLVHETGVDELFSVLQIRISDKTYLESISHI